MFSITQDPIENMPTTRPGRSAGATVVFEGTVRDTNDGQTVKSLEYEALVSLAVKEGEKILEEARQKFPILSADCIHRIGHLVVGDASIRVVVTAGHRKEAFAACHWIVDEVKTRVPIWKKEHYVDGASEWINSRKTLTP